MCLSRCVDRGRPAKRSSMLNFWRFKYDVSYTPKHRHYVTRDLLRSRVSHNAHNRVVECVFGDSLKARLREKRLPSAMPKDFFPTDPGTLPFLRNDKTGRQLGIFAHLCPFRPTGNESYINAHGLAGSKWRQTVFLRNILPLIT